MVIGVARAPGGVTRLFVECPRTRDRCMVRLRDHGLIETGDRVRWVGQTAWWLPAGAHREVQVPKEGFSFAHERAADVVRLEGGRGEE